MCKFFSFCTEPEYHGGQRFYFDWNYRSKNLKDENDSHSLIAKYYNLDEDICNKYEFNPLTKNFKVDQVNSPVDDRIQAEDWVNRVDFKAIVKTLIIKPIVNPLLLPIVDKPTNEHIKLLKVWASVGVSVWNSVGDSVWNSVNASAWDSVRDSVWNSVGDSVWAFVRDSVRDSVWAYASSFVDADYGFDFSSCVELWEAGLVPSFDGETWRLHSGVNAAIVFEITDNELRTP